MNRLSFLLLACVLCIGNLSDVEAQSFKDRFGPLIESSCIHCHDAESETGLDFESLGHDLSDPATFRKWESVFDRVAAGEMPPASEGRPDAALLKTAQGALQADLMAASRSRQQEAGRVPARRLTKRELGNTLNDLLLINADLTSGVPDEVESETFDTVGELQRISAVHMESFLHAADEALELAIKLHRNPYRANEMRAFPFLETWHDKPLTDGGSVTRRHESGQGYIMFADIDYLTTFHFNLTQPGIYLLEAEVAAYQTKNPVTAKIIVKSGASSRIVKTVDVEPSERQKISFTTFLRPGEKPYITLDLPGKSPGVYIAGGAQNYKGRGLAVFMQKIAGPIHDSWPPPSTKQLLDGIELEASKWRKNGPFKVAIKGDAFEEVSRIVTKLAPKIFRRPVSESEIAPFIELAKQALEEEREFVDALRIPLRAMLSSPQFLLFDRGAGDFDHYSIANRLSYFLWKSMPDDELFELANQGRLLDPEVLTQQVDRMLANEKSDRFIKDFVGQWLRLYQVNATTPDDGLYPEYDELLGLAIPQETELFFAELVRENLSLNNVIDSDFTFLNRRLAKHYQIEGVKGQDFRRFDLPDDSPRGGVLTQAAILKTAANGTVTSPVTRGNFVLTSILGTPPSPPPPTIGSVEPDTRGKTTIREILAAHRNTESCNTCHREIDPPGFALESFDPIGRYRTHYRVSGGETKFGGFVNKLPPKNGREVDPTGVTSEGKEFSDIWGFKKLLMEKKDQVARNFISQLVVYSTGGEIQFADRDEVEAILKRTREKEFPVKDIIHEVVRSKMFRNK